MCTVLKSHHLIEEGEGLSPEIGQRVKSKIKTF